MPKANEVATELRKLADSLDREPETIITQPMVSFYCDKKEHFLAIARLFPRPFNKPEDANRYLLENPNYRQSGIWLRAQIDRSKICKLVSPAIPAKYECEPLLSADEESTLTEVS